MAFLPTPVKRPPMPSSAAPGIRGGTNVGFERELTDPNWRAWFDRLLSQGVTGLADSSVAGRNLERGTGQARFGSFNRAYEPNFDPSTQTSASLLGGLRSRQLGHTSEPYQAALEGLLPRTEEEPISYGLKQMMRGPR